MTKWNYDISSMPKDCKLLVSYKGRWSKKLDTVLVRWYKNNWLVSLHGDCEIVILPQARIYAWAYAEDAAPLEEVKGVK